MVVGPNLPQQTDAKRRCISKGRFPSHFFLNLAVNAHLHVGPPPLGGEEGVDLPLGLLLGHALVEVLEDQLLPDALHLGVGLDPVPPFALPIAGACCGCGSGAGGGEVETRSVGIASLLLADGAADEGQVHCRLSGGGAVRVGFGASNDGEEGKYR